MPISWKITCPDCDFSGTYSNETAANDAAALHNAQKGHSASVEEIITN